MPRKRGRSACSHDAIERLECRALLSAVTFFQKFEGIDWTSAGVGGVGNENGGNATLSVGDVQGEIVAGFLYWHGVDRGFGGGNGVYDNENITFDGVGITGVSLGTSGGAGWGGVGSSQTFRADVTDLLRTGVQSYAIAGLASKAGHSADGASLIIVYQDNSAANDRDLYILNGNHVSGGIGQDGLLEATLDDFLYRHGDVRAQLHLADGQSRSDASIRFANESGSELLLDDRPGQFDGDSVPSMGHSRAINGSLWDIHTFDVTAAVGEAGVHSLSFAELAGSADSIGLIALLFDTSARPVNTPPVASDVEFAGTEDTPVSGQLVGTDVDGDGLAFSVVTPPSFGILKLDSSTGSFVYSPKRDFWGAVTFTYRVSDGEEFSNTATVTLNIGSVNDPPIVTDLILATDEDTALAGMITASDVDDAVLQFVLVSEPSHGTVSLAEDGSFVYTPDADVVGDDSFIVAVTDGKSAPVEALVAVRVVAVNDPPVVAPTSVVTDEDTSVSGAITPVDVDDDVFSFLLLNGPSNGTLALAADGTYVYVPDQDWHGDDSFTVSVTDDKSEPVVATVAVHVTSINDAPVTDDGSFTIAERSPAGTLVGTVAASDVDGDVLSFSITGGNSGGAFAIDQHTGTITVADPQSLDVDVNPVFYLTVTVRDGHGGTAAAQVAIHLTSSALEVEIGPAGKVIDLQKRQPVKVVIFSTSVFDARSIDLDSLTFGKSGDEQSLFVNRGGRPQHHFDDVNGDGLLDLVVSFDAAQTGLRPGDAVATLKGRMTDGTEFIGTLPVTVVDGHKKGTGHGQKEVVRNKVKHKDKYQDRNEQREDKSKGNAVRDAVRSTLSSWWNDVARARGRWWRT